MFDIHIYVLIEILIAEGASGLVVSSCLSMTSDYYPGPTSVVE